MMRNVRTLGRAVFTSSGNRQVKVEKKREPKIWNRVAVQKYPEKVIRQKTREHTNYETVRTRLCDD